VTTSLQPSSSVCIVVPAFNESQVITAALTSLLAVVPAADIYVVSDGSTDTTVQLARSLVPNVLGLRRNRGKAYALQALIKKYKLTDRYEYILFADADSQLTPTFLREAEAWMHEDTACIVGTVTSDRRGVISAYRTFEYGLTNRIFKQAQHVMQVITVAPGCASLYRASVLAQLDFSHHTLTEDFDLTLQIHLRKLGRIVYAPKALVVTQDPPTFADYWTQITRWYTGFWQNVLLHRLYLPTKKINAEILLLILDGIGWSFSLVVAILHPHIFLELVELSFVITWSFGLLIIVIEQKPWVLPYVPLFPLIQYLNLSSFAYSFFRGVIFHSRDLGWRKVKRYAA